MLGSWIAGAAALLSVCSPALAGFDLGFGADDDLHHFVTRPDLKAPKFVVTVYEPEEVTPGYWFIAPYANIVQESHPSRYYQACQTGPAIYDAAGELIWSGACLVKNQNTCDFRAWTSNGNTYISAILSWFPQLDPVGRGIVLDKSMRPVHIANTPNTMIPFNMHEFNIIENGKTALHIIQRTQLADVEHISPRWNLAGGRMKAGLVVNVGFREFDLQSGETKFVWWSNEHIDLNASYFEPVKINGPYPDGWDWIHLNAVDKNDDGDYLVTARYTDAVYKVSGKDGHVIWSLGGTTSNFKLDGWNFSRPHDARWIERTATSETITLLDNAGDEHSSISNFSSALIIDLDKSKKPWTARVRTRWIRPDHGRSEKRGNFQLLPNGNAFVGWSENAYISEHSPDGRLLMEAEFTTQRFVTYRAYKFNFTSAPAEPPMLKAFAYGEGPSSSVTVAYVSWNGATEIAEWAFYEAPEKAEATGVGAAVGEAAAAAVGASTARLLAKVSRTGFETVWQASMFVPSMYAVALDAKGNVLGRTASQPVELPKSWPDADEQVIDDTGIKEHIETIPDPEYDEMWDKTEL